ncbi:MAG: hypothetical protein PWR06_768 [Thermoanaerobacteraceae bacterium]|jgi:hypothetical protein|nr:hypothetical protein [Thermoanaerobacteraceae bacterium]
MAIQRKVCVGLDRMFLFVFEPCALYKDDIQTFVEIPIAAGKAKMKLIESPDGMEYSLYMATTIRYAMPKADNNATTTGKSI